MIPSVIWNPTKPLSAALHRYAAPKVSLLLIKKLAVKSACNGAPFTALNKTAGLNFKLSDTLKT